MNLTPEPIKYVKPALMDPENSVSLFDRARKNTMGEMLCVAPAILADQVEYSWQQYIRFLEHQAKNRMYSS